MKNICFWLVALGFLALVVPASAAENEAGFTPLFDGKTLDGWRKVGGGATYQVEDGCIVGKVGPGANTFLRTEQEYGDFILQVDLKLDVPGNSGIQIRSHQRDGRGRVFGYQAEVDVSPRRWSAGIYDEGRRGWIYPLDKNAAGREAFQLDDWNEYEIRAVGPSIKTFCNGVPCADLLDPLDLSGFIALQVHAGKAGVIRWKNIRIKELGQSEWKPLLGSDMSGWDQSGGGQWKFENGVLHGTSQKTEARHGHLITQKTYSDFAVRLKYKANAGNSGLYFRVEQGEPYGVKGFQAEIDPKENAGGLYETAGRAWVVQPKPGEVKKWYRPDQWNEMSVIAIGPRVVVHVNGHKTAELLDDPGRRSGHLALQLHGGQDMDVEFKDLEILDLTPHTPAP